MSSFPSGSNIDIVSWRWVLSDKSRPVNDLKLSLAVIATLINGFLLIRIFKSRRNIKVFQLSLVNMVFSDTLCGCCSIVLYGTHLLTSSLNFTWCYYSSVQFVTFMGFSISAATIMSVERYFQIVLGKTANFKQMIIILVSFWTLHILIGFWPLMRDIHVVPQASEIHCLPDFRIHESKHQWFAAVVTAYIILTLCTITSSYYLVWKKAIVDGFKWNEKSFVMQYQGNRVASEPTMVKDSTEAKRTAENNLMKASSLNVNNSKQNLDNLNSASASEISSSSDRNARKKQIEMTKKLAVITLAIYICWKCFFNRSIVDIRIQKLAFHSSRY
ncbi:hypothetical protein BKA69DRAFT_487434 [Paraphysoderma sedebokerense]|nr:hypothetical protein BKA69DRAFT_487434 [Paraphysoderma sedebokerense]